MTMYSEHDFIPPETTINTCKCTQFRIVVFRMDGTDDRYLKPTPCSYETVEKLITSRVHYRKNNAHDVVLVYKDEQGDDCGHILRVSPCILKDLNLI